MKKQFIKDLKTGQKVRSFFVAKHKQLEYFRDKSKGRFLTIVLADRSGRILARVWENGPQLYEQFEENDVIAVDGRVEEYLGRPQVIVRRLRPARPEDEGVFFSEDDFVPQTEKDVNTLWSTIMVAVEEMADPHLKSLVQGILADQELASGLQAAPATKAMHHSYRGGLLEHIVEMLTLGRCLISLYPGLEQDLLTAGIILHDLGSVEGARYERDIDYSDAGRLVGHIVLGDRIVAERVRSMADFPPELALRLSHMILSHHGETEHGAVREPQTMEASALYLLNKLSAELHHVQQVFESQWDVTRTWTEFDRVTGRSFFRGSIRAGESAPEGPDAEAEPSAPDEPEDSWDEQDNP